jgi:hypothetical protein
VNEELYLLSPQAPPWLVAGLLYFLGLYSPLWTLASLIIFPQIFLSSDFFHHASTFNNCTSFKTQLNHLNLGLLFSESLQAGRTLSFYKVSSPQI